MAAFLHVWFWFTQATGALGKTLFPDCQSGKCGRNHQKLLPRYSLFLGHMSVLETILCAVCCHRRWGDPKNGGGGGSPGDSQSPPSLVLRRLPCPRPRGARSAVGWLPLQDLEAVGRWRGRRRSGPWADGWPPSPGYSPPLPRTQGFRASAPGCLGSRDLTSAQVISAEGDWSRHFCFVLFCFQL